MDIILMVAGEQTKLYNIHITLSSTLLYILFILLTRGSYFTISIFTNCWTNVEIKWFYKALWRVHINCQQKQKINSLVPSHQSSCPLMMLRFHLRVDLVFNYSEERLRQMFSTMIGVIVIAEGNLSRIYWKKIFIFAVKKELFRGELTWDDYNVSSQHQ